MGELASVLITNKDSDAKKVPRIPRVAKAKGNVPSAEEFDALVDVVNKMTTQLRANGTLK